MLKLVKLNKENMPLLIDMLDEWYQYENDFSPSAIRRADYHDFATYSKAIERTTIDENHVKESTFFCLDDERNIFVGAINIRHYLNDDLLLNGGHIGDGIRPSERNKGYGTKMIALGLEFLKEIGQKKILMVCSKTNVASRKTILNNGGVLENEVNVDGFDEQRFWITLK